MTFLTTGQKLLSVGQHVISPGGFSSEVYLRAEWFSLNIHYWYSIDSVILIPISIYGIYTEIISKDMEEG